MQRSATTLKRDEEEYSFRQYYDNSTCDGCGETFQNPILATKRQTALAESTTHAHAVSPESAIQKLERKKKRKKTRKPRESSKSKKQPRLNVNANTFLVT